MSNENTETPRLVSVMDGGTCAGFLINRGPHGVEAFDNDEKSLGVFPDATTAAVAINKSAAPDGAKYLGADPGINGGLAIVAVAADAAPQLIEAIDIPVIGVNAKQRVDAIAIRPARLHRTRSSNAETGQQQRFQVWARRRRH